MNVLTVINARKKFGSVVALDGASFELRQGELLALLGPNGAGKTTLIRAIAGRVRLDGGEIRLFDRIADGRRTPPELGIVPQEIALYPLLTARENLDVFGRLHGLSGADLAKQVDWALEQTGLADRAGEPVKQFSGGMRRRLNIACGVLHRPRIVLLDEPTVGVDPQSRDRIYDMLADLAQSGVSLLLTTHHLEEAEARCSRTVIIDHGKVIAAGHAVGARRRRPSAATGSSRCVWMRRSPRGRPRICRRAPRTSPSTRRTPAWSRRGCATSRVELPPLLERDSPRRAIGGRRRGPRPEPAGRLHPSDRKGAARIMGTLLRIGWLNLRRDRVAQALMFAAADPVLLDLRLGVRQARETPTTTRIRVAVVDEDHSELSARLVEGLRKETGLRVRTTADESGAGPALDRAAGGAPRAERRRARGRGDSERAWGRRSRERLCGQRRAGDSAARPTSRTASRRRWCSGCCRR